MESTEDEFGEKNFGGFKWKVLETQGFVELTYDTGILYICHF